MLNVAQSVEFPLQVIGGCVSVALIYMIGVKWGTEGAFQRCVVQLGKSPSFLHHANSGPTTAPSRPAWSRLDRNGAVGSIRCGSRCHDCCRTADGRRSGQIDRR